MRHIEAAGWRLSVIGLGTCSSVARVGLRDDYAQGEAVRITQRALDLASTSSTPPRPTRSASPSGSLAVRSPVAATRRYRRDARSSRSCPSPRSSSSAGKKSRTRLGIDAI